MAGATLLSLPPEVLTLIFTNPSDLVAIRSVCKKFCKAADRAFALEFISTRDHVALPYSINALVAISAHSFFGPFVKTIRMNAFRALTTIKSPDKTPSKPKSASPKSGKIDQSIKTDQSDKNDHVRTHKRFFADLVYRKLMVQVFGNIKQHGNSINIEVHDSGVAGSCLNSFGLRRLTLFAAALAGCTVSGVGVDIQGLAHYDSMARATKLWTVLRDLLHLSKSSTSPLGALLHPNSDDQTLLRHSLSEMSFELRYLDQWEVRYKHPERFLGIRENVCDLSDTGVYHGFFHALLASTWLSNIQIHDLKILGLSLPRHGPGLSVDSLVPHLKTVTGITFGGMGLDDEEDWSDVVELLSTAPNLVFCRLYDLHTESLSAFQQEQRNDRVIKDGVVVTSIPCGHVPDPAIDVRLGDVSAILKDLAAVLAADTASWHAGEGWDMELTRADEVEDYGSLAGLTLEEMLFDITGGAYGLPPPGGGFFAGF
ncbi:hypothetical protein D6C84_07331 [Aureobasidium pullulans]|uniref:F-box domain-containing protein n=1 Tax=Aureobasidium pullulans TaxID=5580 RepID=A0A4S9XLG6_AURPU|nr:hypothetical protein D6C84_07331 [Aureobasidium pullulans]